MKKFIEVTGVKVANGAIGIYIISLLCYNVVSTYSNSKNALLKYIQSKGPQYESEWEAVKEGAKEKTWERFTHSVIWPITTTRTSIQNFIPWIVLKLNKEGTKKTSKNVNKNCIEPLGSKSK